MDYMVIKIIQQPGNNSNSNSGTQENSKLSKQPSQQPESYISIFYLFYVPQIVLNVFNVLCMQFCD